MANVLIVEDDANVRLLISTRLRQRYNVFTAGDGEEALLLLRTRNVDLVVTDIMMPAMDGYSLVEKIRTGGYDTPVIMLTAKDGLSDKGHGFAVGCDDYLTKPVDFRELIWRIDALLRRYKISNEGRIVIGDVTVEQSSYTVSRGGQTVELPSKEFQLLYLLLSYPGKIFTKDNILDSVWGYNSESDEFTVRTHINRLRKRFEDFEEFEICTIRGVGYKAVIKK